MTEIPGRKVCDSGVCITLPASCCHSCPLAVSWSPLKAPPSYTPCSVLCLMATSCHISHSLTGLCVTSCPVLHTWEGPFRSICSIIHYLLFNNLCFYTSLRRGMWYNPADGLRTSLPRWPIIPHFFFLLPISQSAPLSYTEIINGLDRNRVFLFWIYTSFSRTGLSPANKAAVAPEK